MDGDAKPSLIASGTAEVFAALRAAGASERDPAIRHPDTLAASFIPWAPRFAALAKIPGARRLVPRISELVAPGAYCYELARGRHLDQILAAELERGLDQLVILGAGMDSRPYRFAGRLADVEVFEVDHPITAAHKRDAVRRSLGAPPANVRYVEADFEDDELERQLRAAGYRETRRTLFLWSGVSGYLSEPAVDGVLAFVVDNSPQSSAIVFDYWHRGIIAGDISSYGARQASERVAKMGEPYRSGFDPEHLVETLSERGLAVISNLGPSDLEDRYLRRSDGSLRGRPYGFLGIAHARVGRRG